MRAIALLPCVILTMAHPAMAQDATATLRIRGNIMISTGGEFITARDSQPVIAGQRILVGDNASATVEYDRDCKRSFDTAGVHLIPPARCDDDNDRDDEDRSQEREQQSTEQAGSAGGSVATASGVGSLTTLAVALGSAAVGAGLMEQREESPPDHPISR